MFSALLLGLVALFADQTSGNAVDSASLACYKLAILFPGSVYWPRTDTYNNQSTAIFSQTCLLSPTCVVEPSSAVDVSKAVIVIKVTGSRFSVRAGGHMPVPGAQSVQPGVMISLSRLNARNLVRQQTVASIGPGQVWSDVYHWLAGYGLAVNGGRYPTVGVGGLLVGGGIGYFSSTHGWSCDSVVAYEVVLASGAIVEATAGGRYADLFWALRGGHNNLGIVTRFDMTTLPVTAAFLGGSVWNARNASTQAHFFAALDAYLAPGGGADDPRVATSAIVAVSPGSGPTRGDSELLSVQFAPGRDASPAAFRNFTAIQAPVVQPRISGVVPDWTALLGYLEPFGARGSRQLFWSVSFKPDPRALRIANSTVVDLAFAELAGVPGAIVELTYQPVSRAWLLESQKRGGNVMDLDPAKGTFVAGLIAASWNNAADDAKVNAFAAKAASIIKTETAKLQLDYDFVYLNDAGPAQKPFETYGGGKSISRLTRIRQKYDPDGFLQKYLAHGFTF